MKILTNILVISEDADFLGKLADIFPAAHYLKCRCCREAIEVIEAGFAPELLIVDLVLPELTGPETLEVIQQNLAPREVPGIIVTSNDHLVLYSTPRPPELLGILNKKGEESFIYERVQKLWDDYQAELVDGSDQDLPE